MGKKIKVLKKKITRLKAELKPAKAKAKTAAKVKIISPLAPKDGFPDLPPIDGVSFASAAAGVRYAGRTDVTLIQLKEGTVLSGVFTRSSTRSAPVLDCQAKIAGTSTGGAAIIVNSGNSNAFTGARGIQSVQAITGAVASLLDLPESRVYSASTGVIGEPLPHDRIIAVLETLSASLDPVGMADAARAIMTTDTFPKGAGTEVTIGKASIRIAGIAKGSGMIAPDMATMLVYIFTDARIDKPVLDQIVQELNQTSFNAITVDSDTSTSDTMMVAATGTSSARRIAKIGSPAANAFRAGLSKVMLDLAHQVVRDGEGATKFVEVAVTGADTDEDARSVAMSIANSPLVKTAIAGEDPNWGRVVMAVGKSGAKADRDTLSIHFGDVLVAERGWVAPSYREELGVAHMKQDEIALRVDLGLGSGHATVWTCDLTHRYIDINADYRS